MKNRYFLILTILTITIIFFNSSCKKEDSNPITPDTPKETFEGSGSVGSKGAVVQITNQSSPIKGAYVDIPEGALSNNVTISISQAPSNIKYQEDSTALIIQLEPNGLIFNKPIQIGIPYNNSVNNTDQIKAFYFNPDSNLLQQIPIISKNTSEKVVVVSSNHLSEYIVDDDGIRWTINMYYNGKISANVFLDGYRNGNNYGLAGIPTNLLLVLQGIYNAKILVDHGSYLFYGEDPSLIIQVELKKKVNYWFDDPIETKRLLFHRKKFNTGDRGGELFIKRNNTLENLYNIPNQNSDEREQWFCGDPLIFNFDTTPQSGSEYYVNVKWVITHGYTFDFILSAAATKTYSFSNYESSLKTSMMIQSDPDADNNYIIDSYQNKPPLEPSNPTPSMDATNQSINVDLSWQCSDPENDPLTYDIYFGTATNPTLVKSNHTSTSYDPGTLNYSTTYNWKIVAKDNHSNTKTGPTWKFSTAAQTVNQPPNEPSNPTPILNATNQSINVDLSWQCSDPENDPLTYDIYFGTSTNPPLVKSNHTSTSYDPGTLQYNTPYNWKIVAKDDHSNSKPGPIWKFTTTTQTVNQPPNEPSNPSPSLNATNQSINVDISWECSDPDGDPLTYDIYFGTSTNPPLVKSNHTSTSYDPGTLDYSTPYNWKIVAKDDHSNSKTGPPWKFTTAMNSSAWSIITEIPYCEGFGLHDLGATALDDYIYVAGGQVSYNSRASAEFARYNLLNLTWEGLSWMNHYNLKLRLENVFNKVYAVGGHDFGSNNGFFEEYDPQVNQWINKASMLTKRSEVASCIYDNKIYTFGGDLTTVVEVYNPINDTWSSKIPIPFSITGASAVVLNYKIYLIGGYNGSNYLKQVLIYDPILNTWSNGPDMQVERAYFGACVFDGRIYVFGGMNNSGVQSSTEMFSLTYNSWTYKQPISYSLYRFAITTTNNKIYLCGGIGPNFVSSNIIQYDPILDP
jgi:hypothetical protein